MGCGDVCLLNDEGYRAIEGSSRPPLINLTVPYEQLVDTARPGRKKAGLAAAAPDQPDLQAGTEGYEGSGGAAGDVRGRLIEVASSRVTGHSRNPLARWLERASTAAKRFNQRMLRDFEIIELQADARCTFIGNKSRATWLCAAIEVCSRLWAGSVLGRRSSRNATAVLNDVILRGRVVGFPLIATDGFEYYVGGIERLFGSACVSGHVLKTRRNDRVVRVERRRRIGTAGRLKAALWESEDSETLHTSFVERLNLTIRQGSASVRRRSPCHARGADQLHGHVDLLRCSYNFIRPHRALTCGRETRTPAMQAGWVNAPMNWSDIFTAPAALYAFHVAFVRVPVAVQLMHTSPAALSSFSWPHEHRSAA